jgi:hypothetical protein
MSCRQVLFQHTARCVQNLKSMPPLDTTNKMLAGMQEIERATTTGVRERSMPISTAVFSWNHGEGALAGLPDPVPMNVRVGPREVSAHWPKACLHAPWDRIEWFDVRGEIERIVDALAPM